MASGTLAFRGGSINKVSCFSFILPENAPGPLPVFYLLHGYSDDHTAWPRMTSIERYVNGLPLIVIMPDGGHGWYTNSKQPGGMRYEDYIVKDLVQFVDRTFDTIPARKGRVIGGLSMGAYGALKIALGHPDMFCSVTAHSGPLGIASGPLRHKRGEQPSASFLERQAIFGRNPAGGEDDCVALARKCRKDRRPAIRIDCGTEDFLIEDNRTFHARLEDMAYAHEYTEFPGDHNWHYWDLHVREALAFHRRHLKL